MKIKRLLHLPVIMFMLFPVMPQTGTQKQRISVMVSDAERKVDILFGGKLFASYIYPETLEKPILYPVMTASGTVITRGFPLQPRPGERIDHPHHVGWWLNYGDVNGLDFWNNSYAIPDSEKPKYGSIRHIKVLKAESGMESAILMVKCQWVDNAGDPLLDEVTSFTFTGDQLRRRIVRTTTLTALNREVVFGDSKEGMCAIRVDRAFETPSETPEVFTDAAGNPTTVPALNNEGVNGEYRSSEGLEKDAVWGTRARWVSLSAEKNGEKISICLFDHPDNPGYPAYWHARGYGLFAVNNIGRKSYNNSEPVNSLIVKMGHSVTFKHMLLIRSGGFETAAEMDREAADFAKE
jgi:hypothetical protein